MSDRYAVMGCPVAHSQSPFIHAQFATQTGQDLTYEAIHVEAGDLARSLAEFRHAGGKGLNITLPYKQQAHALACRSTGRAERAGAVNTISFGAHGEVLGDNTDGIGLVRDLAYNHGVRIRGATVLLLGAGGAARGVLGPLIDAAPERVVIANRTHPRARELVARFESSLLTAQNFAALTGRPFDIVINATSASLASDDVPPIAPSVLTGHTCCYDMMYGAEPTPFLRWSRNNGTGDAVDGLGMLVEQAAESFHVWRGVRPRTGPVLAAVRRHLKTQKTSAVQTDSA